MSTVKVLRVDISAFVGKIAWKSGGHRRHVGSRGAQLSTEFEGRD
jgi:hypothetical protein